jgi:hypothetical protein
MASQLQRAIAEAETLPAEDRGAIAVRRLAGVREDSAAGRTIPLDDVIAPDESAR